MTGEERFFLDTNVLLYVLSAGEPEKRARASQWMDAIWERRNGCVSWQVMHEYYAKATQKLGVSPALARATVLGFVGWGPEQPSAASIERAWHWCDSAKINFWDAMIVAAAEQAGCRYLLSEDFQTGRTFGGVTVVNPFQEHPESYFG